MSKKMNLQVLQAQESKLFTQKKVICDKYEILVDEVFKKSKIKDMMRYLLTKFTYIQENNMTVNMTDYAEILLLKFFTTIEIPEEVEKQLTTHAILLNLEYDDRSYLDIIVDSFDKDEMKKLTNKMYEWKEDIDKLTDEIKNETDSKIIDIEEIINKDSE